ncbi:MAG: acetyl-CoA C-acyltransferase [Chitinophagales bacterium]|nr:acetyl-CoA C-acyltransferase [Chitinophagales bacterium]
MKKVVLVDGCRIPFQKSGTAYKNLMAYQLAQFAIKGLLDQTNIPTSEVQSLILGCVIQNLRTSNVAREAAFTSGLGNYIPCHTITMACISANKAITEAHNQIALGQADVVIAGGTDSVSDIPIQFPKEMRQKLMDSQKMKSIKDYLKFASQLRPTDFKPEVPAIAEFTTGKTMGQDCDRLADRFGISRQEQDAFALRSHKLAALATEEGWLAREMASVDVPPNFETIATDNGIRGDSTMDKLTSLPPAFTRPDGTLTAANSSFLTDGAAVVLLMSEEKALALGYRPKATIRSFSFTAQNPATDLLLGPAFASPIALERAGLQMQDIGVFEFHEAFAGQILANLACLASDKFAQDYLQRSQKVGEVDMDALNLWGGSLSIGHPFGATGARLVTTAANRLISENQEFALLASCAAGGHGHAMVLERYG